MNRSEKVAALFAALSKCQGELPNPKKDTSGYGYNYADLAGCIQVAKEHLAKHGLAVSQLVGDNQGNTTIETILAHESGEYISTICHVPIATLEGQSGKNPAQVMGASITYMRRYQYAAIVGMAQEDDDAASATKGSAQKPKGTAKSAMQDDTRPWLNKPELDDMIPNILKAIKSGKRTPSEVIKNLEKTYKLNKTTRETIHNLAPQVVT